MIKIEHLRKEYEEATPLKDVNVTINKGDVISIIGPSGTGKSTLINCINMLDAPTSGKIYFEGECITDKDADINKVRQKMGMVFQSFNLFPHLTIVENIMLAPVELLNKTKQEAYDKAIELLKMVGLADKAYSYPSELSGGQQQRVAIVRALAMEPEVMLFDEPTSALDPTMVGEVQRVIKNLANEGMTMLIVTHEMKLAKSIANRVFYMDQGEIYEDGPPEQIFDNPQRERTRQFIKKLKVFNYRIDSSFSFISMNEGIEKFAAAQMIGPKLLRKMMLVSEELCVQMIIPHLGEKPEIELCFEYSEEDEAIDMTITYGGEQYDPTKEGDELSMLLVKNSSQDISYIFEDNVNKLAIRM